MNLQRWHLSSFTVCYVTLSIILCFTASCVAQESPNDLIKGIDFKTYYNPIFKYTFVYPSDTWTLEENSSDYEMVELLPKTAEPMFISFMSFHVKEGETNTPIEIWAKRYLDSVRRKSLDDIKLLNPGQRCSKGSPWQWFYTLEGKYKGRERWVADYFLISGGALYRCSLDCDKKEVKQVINQRLLEMVDILDSFRLTAPTSEKSLPTQTSNRLLQYEHPEYSYTIQYPAGWKLDDDKLDQVLISHHLGTKYAFITIHTSHSGMPIEKFADFFKLYLQQVTTDEWSNLKFTCSQKLSYKWDWLLCFQYTDIIDSPPIEAQGEAYIVKTQASIFTVQWDGAKEYIETCKQIVNSFSIE